jgi:hypothetical protein
VTHTEAQRDKGEGLQAEALAVYRERAVTHTEAFPDCTTTPSEGQGGGAAGSAKRSLCVHLDREQ